MYSLMLRFCRDRSSRRGDLAAELWKPFETPTAAGIDRFGSLHKERKLQAESTNFSWVQSESLAYFGIKFISPSLGFLKEFDDLLS